MKCALILRAPLLVAILGLLLGGNAHAAASLTIGGAIDSEEGSGYDLDAWVAAGEYLSFSAGVGHSDSSLAGAEYSGKSVRVGSDVMIHGANLGVGYSKWKDSKQLQSHSTLVSLGWLAKSGFNVGAVFDDRSLRIHYTVQVLAQTRNAQVSFDGKGRGGELGYFGDQWNLGLRYVSYSYGRTLGRVRNAFDSPNTTAFPRLESLFNSIVTRSASAPDRDVSLSLGRSLTRSSLHGQWLMQRDALTETDVHSLSVRHGYRFTPSVELGTTLGASFSGSDNTLTYGGLSLTLRR
jgi:hypothetical protein